jgi:predicted MPP superfamily phosphohydrolase
VHIHIPKPVEGKDSLTIVLMSDLHISESIGKKQIRRFVELSNAERPDLILIGGDIMDYESLRAEKECIEEEFRQLNAPLGVYMILGNHEYRANRMAKIRWLEKTGGSLLVDSVAMPDSTFYLIGRDDILNVNRASLQTLMQGVDKSKPVIVLEHRPTFAREAIENQCDLGLYGHTHNCQYWPFSFLLRFIFEFPYGYFSEGNTHIYVTSGIGFTGPPFRIGTRSEMVVLHLAFDK